jgi:hypothetical protein
LQSNSVKYKFSGHQTFAFRYGWLEKGVKGACKDPSIFSDKGQAMVQLGVGKNMVQSIQHWCQVTQLLQTRVEGRKSFVEPTHLAKNLLIESPWDEFLEDDGSLWLIHWHLTTNPAYRTTWHLLLSLFHRPDFTKKELVDFIMGHVSRNGVKVADSVISRDVDCFLRTYLPAQSKAIKTDKLHPEETFDCPLIELDLIQVSGDGEFYRFAIGPKPSLPLGVFGYALLQYFNTKRDGRNTLSVQECMYGEGSPGQIFKLDENSLIEYVEELERLTDGDLVMDETAGLKQIYRKVPVESMDLLYKHYRSEANNER